MPLPNIIQMEDDLKNVSDDQLVEYMQNPPSGMPQFLTLQEMDRRREMRESFQATQGQPQQSIAQELTSYTAGGGQQGPQGQQGIGGLPAGSAGGAEMQSRMNGNAPVPYRGGQVQSMGQPQGQSTMGAPPMPKGMASGGIVGYQNQGQVNPLGGQPGAEQSYGEIFGEMGTALEGVSAEDIVKAVLPDLTDEKDVALLAITLGGAIGVPVIGGTPGAVASSGRGAYKAYKLLGGKLGPPLTKLVQKAYAQLKSGIGAAGRGGPNVQGSRRLASGRFGSAEALGGQRIQEGLGALGRGAGWSAQQFNPVKSLGGVGTKRVLGRTIPAIAAGTYGARRAFNEGVDAGELSDEQVLAEIAGVDPHQGARMAPFYQDVAEPEVADVTVDKPPVVPPAATAGISGLPGLPDYASYSAQLAELDKSPQQIRDNAITNALIELSGLAGAATRAETAEVLQKAGRSAQGVREAGQKDLRDQLLAKLQLEQAQYQSEVQGYRAESERMGVQAQQRGVARANKSYQTAANKANNPLTAKTPGGSTMKDITGSVEVTPQNIAAFIAAYMMEEMAATNAFTPAEMQQAIQTQGMGVMAAAAGGQRGQIITQAEL